MIGAVLGLAPLKKSGFQNPAVFYNLHENAAATVRDRFGNGPDVSVGGTVAGLWANENRLTFHSSGNTIRTPNGNAYIESLFDMSSLDGGALVTAFDVYYGTKPSTSTENLFAVGLPGSGAAGGIRIALTTGNAFTVLYKPNGTAEQTLMSSSVAAPAAGGVRNSYVLEWDFSIPERVAVTVMLNGKIVIANDTPRNVAPAVSPSAGLTLGSYATSSSAVTGMMGAGGSVNAGLARFLAVRSRVRDPKLAYAISDYWFGGAFDLPPYMRGV